MIWIPLEDLKLYRSYNGKLNVTSNSCGGREFLCYAQDISLDTPMYKINDYVKQGLIKLYRNILFMSENNGVSSYWFDDTKWSFVVDDKLKSPFKSITLVSSICPKRKQLNSLLLNQISLEDY